jgi:uncharacterized protein with HEPN domain
MPSPHSKVHSRYFADIVSSIDHIHHFVRNISFDDFIADRMRCSAVERELLIISEAAIRLGDTAETLCPGQPWHDIRGIGNKLRHEYDGINLELIWNLVQDDLPSLRTSVNRTLNSQSDNVKEL